MRKSWHTNNTSARTHPETRAQIKNPDIPLAYLSLEHSCQRSLSSSQRDPPLQTRRRDAANRSPQNLIRSFGVDKIYDLGNNYEYTLFPFRKYICE